jgi:tryptophan-rich sensory protein
MNAHSKPLRVVALDGIYQLDQSTGHYERLEIFEEEPRWPYPGAIIISITLLSWAVIGIAAYAVWRLFA